MPGDGTTSGDDGSVTTVANSLVPGTPSGVAAAAATAQEVLGAASGLTALASTGVDAGGLALAAAVFLALGMSLRMAAHGRRRPFGTLSEVPSPHGPAE